MIRFVMLDLDGTLLNHRRQVTKTNKQLLKAVHELQVPIALCTGRNLRLTKPVMKQLPIPVYYCTVGGTEIYSPDHQLLFSNNLNQADLKAILDVTRDHHCLIQAVCRDGYYLYGKDASVKKYEVYRTHTLKGWIQSKIINLNYLASESDFLTPKFERVQEMVIGGDHEALMEIKATIENQLDHLQARMDLWPNYLFIGRKHNSKGQAVDFFADYLNIAHDEILALGDDYNDVDMFEKVKYSIAMAGAIDHLKTVAYDETLSNRDHGVAHALHHYVIEARQHKIKED